MRMQPGGVNESVVLYRSKGRLQDLLMMPKAYTSPGLVKRQSLKISGAVYMMVPTWLPAGTSSSLSCRGLLSPALASKDTPPMTQRKHVSVLLPQRQVLYVVAVFTTASSPTAQK